MDELKPLDECCSEFEECDFIHYDDCFFCKYFRGDEGGVDRCLAFPDGIPDKINSIWQNHLTVAPDQKGDYVFEPIDKEDNILMLIYKKFKKQQKK